MNMNATIPNLVCVRVRRSLVTVHTLSCRFAYGIVTSHIFYVYNLAVGRVTISVTDRRRSDTIQVVFYRQMILKLMDR